MFPREDFITCFISLKGCRWTYATSVYCWLIFCPAEISTSKATFLIHWSEQLKQLCRQNKPYLWHLFRKEDLFSWHSTFRLPNFNSLLKSHCCLSGNPVCFGLSVGKDNVHTNPVSNHKHAVDSVIYPKSVKIQPVVKGMDLSQPESAKNTSPSLIYWLGGLTFHSACISQIHTN